MNKYYRLVAVLCIVSFVWMGVVEANFKLLSNADGEDVKIYSDVKVGDYIEFGRFEGQEILWRVINKDNGELFLFSEKLLAFKPFAGSENPDDEEDRGSNNWENSALRWWLNSDEKDGVFDGFKFIVPTKEHVWEGFSAYGEEAGFLAFFTEEEKELIKEREYKTAVYKDDNDVLKWEGDRKERNLNVEKSVDNISEHEYEHKIVLEDKVFLLSLEELYEYVINKDAIEEVRKRPVDRLIGFVRDNIAMFWDYEGALDKWNGGDNFIQYRLRTPDTNNPNDLLNVYEDEKIAYSAANGGNNGVAPAIILSEEVGLIGEGTKDDPYRVVSKDEEDIAKLRMQSMYNFLESLEDGTKAVDFAHDLLKAELSEIDDKGSIEDLRKNTKLIANKAIEVKNTIELDYIKEGQRVSSSITKDYFKGESKSLDEIVGDVLMDSNGFNNLPGFKDIGFSISPTLSFTQKSEQEDVRQSDVKVEGKIVRTASDEDIKRVSLDTDVAKISLNASDLVRQGDENHDISFHMKKFLEEESRNLINTEGEFYEFNIDVGEDRITRFNDDLFISLPYDLKDGENGDYLTVFYLDENEEAHNIIGFYNEDSKTVNFRTDHLSVFFVTLNHASFKDNNVDWAKRFIDSMAAKGIVSGSNEQFKPRDMVTRAEFVTMIINALRINQIEYENQFVDVKKEDWFSHMVATGFYNQIISGYGNQRFGPYDNITREQMAVIIANVMQEFMGMQRIGNVEFLRDIFSDSSDISQYAKESIISAYRYGIVSGRGEGFSPKAHMTRAEAATVIYKLVELMH